MSGHCNMFFVDPSQRTPTKPRWFCALLMVCFCWNACAAIAQPPGTFPNSKALDSTDSGFGGIRFQGYMFLDENGNHVLMPLMRYERMLELWDGGKTPSRLFEFKPLKVVGRVSAERAELDVELRLAVDPTGGQWVTVPLKMGNFRLMAWPEFTSSPAAQKDDSEKFSVAPDQSGYVLYVRSEKAREITIKMQVQAAVKSASVNVLDFQLPTVSSTVQLRTTPRIASAEVFGIGNEILTTPNKSESGDFEIVSSGGSFQFRWGPKRSAEQLVTTYEVDQDLNFTWNTPEDEPSLSARWTIRSSRDSESVSSFDVRLPAGAQWKEDLLLISSGQKIAPLEKGKDVYTFTIPEEERSSEINVSFKVQLNGRKRDKTGWYDLRIPQVMGAIRQQGELTIKTIDDYRLRWRSRRGVQRVLGDTDTTGDRSYKFSFNRGSVLLPINLSAQQQQLRVASSSIVQIRDQAASLEMSIRSRGEAADSRQLQIDFGPWQFQGIVDAATGESLLIGQDGNVATISLTSDIGDPPSMIQVNAIHPAFASERDLQFQLPQLKSTDPTVVIESSDVTIGTGGRSYFVVELPESKSMVKSQPVPGEDASILASRFRIQPPDAKATVVGSLEAQPPQVTLESTTKIELSGETMTTTMEWDLWAKTDLEGKLDIAFPDVVSRAKGTADESGETVSSSKQTDWRDWTVNVNGRAARLKLLGNGSLELISERLADGKYNIKWTNLRTVDDTTTQSVALPVPRNTDVEVLGDILVTVQGRATMDLQFVDSPSETSLTFDEPPREPIRVRAYAKSATERDLSIEKAIIRSAIGQTQRQEQVLALVRGGDSFRVRLLDVMDKPKVEAFMDQRRVAVRRDNDELIIDLPSDAEPHLIDLRIWTQREQKGWFTAAKPTVRLPYGAGRVYWQVILPDNAHVVWATPTIRRAMTWRIDRWCLTRQPIQSEMSLIDWVGKTDQSVMPSGNKYLYLGSDISSFKVRFASRALLWMLIGSCVMALAAMLTYLPKTRSPATVVVGALCYTGLLSIAPDAAVMAGQIAFISLVLVVVMLVVRVLYKPERTGQPAPVAPEPAPYRSPSTRSLATPSEDDDQDEPHSTENAASGAAI